MEVAKTILEQLGGNKFIVMTGAKAFIGSKTGLSFKLPGKNFCKHDINYVKITLTPADLYDVEYSRCRGLKITTVAKVEGIYFDQLTGDFEEKTGLRTRLF